jgi:alkylation response protein AidB-like acyl-CoA dehydrogenase
LIPFELTGEQKALRETAKKFAEKELYPVAIEADENHKFLREIFTKMGKVGFAGMLLPPKYDGAGLNYVEFSLVFQALNKGSVGLSTSLVPHTGQLLMINEFGTEDQKREFIPPCARGERLGAFAMTEADAGSDAAAIRCKAILDRDHYILNGTKCFITNAGEAEQYLVIARSDPNIKGYKGLSAFIVPSGLPGSSISKIEKKMGARSNPTGSLTFEDVPLPKENLLGEEGNGLKIGLTLMDYARITAAIGSVGVAQAAIEVAVNYSKNRVQFGKPIFEFQAIQFMLADMAIQFEAAESMLYSVCNLLDLGCSTPSMVAMLKVFASDMAMKVTTDAVQVLGGYGYMQEYRVEGYMRDAKVMQIYDGTNEIQRIIVARDL